MHVHHTKFDFLIFWFMIFDLWFFFFLYKKKKRRSFWWIEKLQWNSEIYTLGHLCLIISLTSSLCNSLKANKSIWCCKRSIVSSYLHDFQYRSHKLSQYANLFNYIFHSPRYFYLFLRMSFILLGVSSHKNYSSLPFNN